MNFLFSLIIVLTIIASPLKALSDEVVLAGGCFWCLEHDLEYLEGVNSVDSGYSGGDLDNPTYNNHAGHQEVVLVDFDPKLVNLDEILRLYLRNIDPLDGKGQFCDRGDSYRPVIFFEDSIGEDKSNDALLAASKASAIGTIPCFSPKLFISITSFALIILLIGVFCFF